MEVIDEEEKQTEKDEEEEEDEDQQKTPLKNPSLESGRLAVI